MPRVIKFGDLTIGTHGERTTVPIPTVTDVTIDGIAPIVVGDQFLPHTLPLPHPVIAIIGSPSVFINGKPVVRDGDPTSCGDITDTLYGTVFCNGGGLGGPGAGGDPNQTTGFRIGPPNLIYPASIPVRIYYTLNVTTGNRLFIRSELETTNPTDAYTILTEEQTNAQYLNYPGQPLTSESGAEDLPEYASETYRLPIAIDNIELYSPRKHPQLPLPFGTNIPTVSPDSINVDPNRGVIQGTYDFNLIPGQVISPSPSAVRIVILSRNLSTYYSPELNRYFNPGLSPIILNPILIRES